MLGSALREQSKVKFPDDQDKWLNFAIYDASKIEYEDLLGITNAKALSEGRMEYIKTPTTVWGKRLVCYDEFNRTNPDRQSNLLEHIRSRTIQGIPTGTQFILAAMNPYGDTGTEELSDALVDRFLFYLQFPEFSDFPDDVKALIIERIGQSDCVALKHYWDEADTSLSVSDDSVNSQLAAAGEDLERTIGLSMTLFGTLQQEIGNKITHLVRQCFDSLNADMTDSADERVSLLSGRRGGLVRRGLIAHRAVELAKAEIYSTPVRPMIDMLREVFPTCMPFGVSGRATPEEVTRLKTRLYDDISTFWPALDQEVGGGVTDIVYELFRTPSLHRQLYLLLKHGNTLNEQMQTEAWTRLATDPEFDFSDVLQIVATHLPTKIPENVQLAIPKTKDLGTQMMSSNEGKNVFLEGDQVECAQEIRLLVERWKDEPIINFFVAKSLKRVINGEGNKKLNENELRVRINDISQAAKEVRMIVSNCMEEAKSV